jgi:1-deoxy-D-xylulose-5-phosphate reductoisomerase
MSVTAAPFGIALLGSTGSIGGYTLDVIARHPERFRLIAISARTQHERLLEQCRRFRPRLAVLSDRAAAEILRRRVREEGLAVEVLAGEEGLEAAATHPEAHFVVAAIVGAAGLLPVLAAVRAGRRVLLANKEPLVMAGHLFLEAARASGAELLPVDSEHNAIFQCLPAGYRPGLSGRAPAGVVRLWLTASGGPFRRLPLERLARVTPEEACAHPNWVMGRKISVDSATLMNKGLEVIEACRLFAVRPEQVRVVIHPQSIVHSLVEYADGSLIAQMSHPDMRTPLAHALGYPERIASGVRPLDLAEVGRLDFEQPDRARFPCLDLAYAAARRGGTAPAILNAANEVAVEAFLARAIAFTDIAPLIAAVLDAVPADDEADLQSVLAADARAREQARRLCGALPSARRQQKGA